MKLSRKDYQALKLAADLADAQRLLTHRNLSHAQGASVIGALLGLLLLVGLGTSLVSSDRQQVQNDRVASIENLR
jgi:hypothetical protein